MATVTKNRILCVATTEGAASFEVHAPSGDPRDMESLCNHIVKRISACNQDVVIDLGDLTAMSSPLAATLVLASSRLREGGHGLRVINLSDAAKAVISVLGVDRLLRPLENAAT